MPRKRLKPDGGIQNTHVIVMVAPRETIKVSKTQSLGPSGALTQTGVPTDIICFFVAADSLQALRRVFFAHPRSPHAGADECCWGSFATVTPSLAEGPGRGPLLTITLFSFGRLAEPQSLPAADTTCRRVYSEPAERRLRPALRGDATGRCVHFFQPRAVGARRPLWLLSSTMLQHVGRGEAPLATASTTGNLILKGSHCHYQLHRQSFASNFFRSGVTQRLPHQINSSPQPPTPGSHTGLIH